MSDMMSTGEALQIFTSGEFGKVRVIMCNGEPWFVASDVATALGYANPSEAVRDNCKYAELLKTSSQLVLEIPPRGMLIIPESDVYALIFRSNLPKAEEFRRWVCEEVLPSIRKTGLYLAGQPKTLPEALRAYADEIERRELAERQRDYYKRTKAEIGSRREATAMGTASAATKRANNWKRSAGELADVAETQRDTIDELNDQIGQGNTWRMVKAISWLPDIFETRWRTKEERKRVNAMYSQVGRKLTALGCAMNLPPVEIPDEEYGTIKKHHVDVIQRFYNQLLADPCMMQKWRK